jgi:hypothetical protein
VLTRAKLLALQVGILFAWAHRLARRRVLAAFGLSAGVLATGPVEDHSTPLSHFPPMPAAPLSRRLKETVPDPCPNGRNRAREHW